MKRYVRLRPRRITPRVLPRKPSLRRVARKGWREATSPWRR